MAKKARNKLKKSGIIKKSSVSKKLITITPRRLKKPTYKSFRLQKRIKSTAPKLPNSFRLFQNSLKLLWQHKRMFTKLILIYGLLTLIFVRGLGGGLNVTGIKDTFKQAYKDSFDNFSTSFTIFGYLLGSALSTNAENEIVRLYQGILFVLISLVTIWSLRQTLAGVKISIRDAFYKGIAPLIQFMACLVVLGIQLIPFSIGNFLYNTVRDNGLATTGVEKSIWLILFFLSLLLTLYMISSSLFSLYIITLPDMTPMKALKSARKLVYYRRFEVMRRIIFLPILLIITSGIFMIPILFWATSLAEPIFYILTMISLPFIHTYLYILYRELLKE